MILRTTALRATLVATCVTLLGGPMWGQDQSMAEDAGCREEIAQAAVRARSAQYDQATELYEQAAAASAWCRARAQAGLAGVWNSRGNVKKAVATAELAIAGTNDPTVLSLAYHQLGRALFRKGQRVGKRTARAEDAFRRAVELSGGRDEKMVHALARLYRETKQSEPLAALVAAYPAIKLWTRGDQAALFRRRVTSPCMKPTGSAYWTRSLARFTVRTGPTFPGLEDLVEPEEKTARAGEDEDSEHPTAMPTFERPPRLEGKAPQYTDLVRRNRVQGVARLEALVTKEGTVERVRIVRGLDAALVRSAQLAICAWTFEALAVDGKARPFYLVIDADFRLE